MQLDAAKLAAEGQAQNQVAKSVGVHRSTIARWVAREDFQQAVSRFRSEMLSGTAEAVRETTRSRQQILDRIEDLALRALERQLEICVAPETQVHAHRSLPAIAMAGEWTGLKARGLGQGVQRQLYELKEKMSDGAFAELLSALSECGDESSG